jgi:hypothetical protein
MELRPEIMPPAIVVHSRGTFEIIRPAHLYLYQHHIMGYPLFQILEQQAVHFLRIIYDICPARHMKKKALSFSKKFQPYGKIAVKFMESLLRTGYKKPQLPQFVHL